MPRLLPLSSVVGKLPVVGGQLDNPQNAATVRDWPQRAGLERIEVLKAGHLVGRAVRRCREA